MRIETKTDPERVQQAGDAGVSGGVARQSGTAGSIDKRDRILAGKAAIEEGYNEGKDALYQWKSVGEVAQTTAMPKVHPDVLRSGDAPTIQAAEALVKAQAQNQWGQKDLTRNKKMTSQLIAQLDAHHQQPEVADFLKRLRNDPARVDSRELHYIQRRYLDGRPFESADDMDALYQQVMKDPDAQVYQVGGRRYQVRSPREGWIAIVEPDGTRVSVYPDLSDDFGEPLWNLKSLIL